MIKKPLFTRRDSINYSLIENAQELIIEDEKPFLSYLEVLQPGSRILFNTNFAKATTLLTACRKPKLIQAEIVSQLLSKNKYSETLMLTLKKDRLFNSDKTMPFVADTIIIEKKLEPTCFRIDMSLEIKPLSGVLPYFVKNYLLKNKYAGNRLNVYSLGILSK